MTTKNTTPAETPARKRKAPGSGGNKGTAIMAWFQSHPEGATVKDVAAACECTTARVYEVVRANDDIVKDGQVVRLTTAKPATPRKRASKKAATTAATTEVAK